MVLLECDAGSRAAVVLCPKCGRISRQQLGTAYVQGRNTDLVRQHTCPICAAVYNTCDPSQSEKWSASYARYSRNAYSYNQSVKENYEQTSSAKTGQPKADSPSASVISPSLESGWESLFSENTLKSAKTYYNAGRVNIVSHNSYSVSGTVQGTDIYSVIITLKDTTIKGMHCSCPYARTGANCKHQAAMILALIDIAKQRGRLDTTPAPEDNKTMIPQNVSTENKSTPVAPPVPSQPKSTNAVDEQSFSNQPIGQTTDPIKTTDSTSTDSPVASTGDITRKIDRWKRELLDTGKRNRMINFRETKRTTLRILEPEASELFTRLAFSEKPLTFQKPVSKNSDLRTYSMIALMETLSYSLNVQRGDIKTAGTVVERDKTLKNLRAKARLAQEEQGTNILYLCFGFIYYKRDKSTFFKAPLLMMPVTIGLKALNSPFTLSRYDDEIEVNPTLAYLFSTEYNIDLPPFELKNKDSFDEYLSQIEVIVDKRGWKITREASLGLLSFLKISIYHDLENNGNRMLQHPVIRAMGGDISSVAQPPSSITHFDFDSVKPSEWHEVIDADSSQEEAILLSKAGVSFVMQGPPGTGKSQTITNIIAEALADGKKVLFVSEKAAALEVVLKRLAEVHLDDFCLSLHSHKANKKEIIASIGANLSLEQEYVDRNAVNELSELFNDRAYLSKYAGDVHAVIEPFGESVYTAYGVASKLEDATLISFEIDDPKSISREQYTSFLYALDAFEKALHNFGGPLDGNPWHGTTVKTSGQTFKTQLIEQTARLSQSLREIEGCIKRINETYHCRINLTWNAAQKDLAAICTALDLPLFPRWWTVLAKRETLMDGIKRTKAQHKYLDSVIARCREIFGDSVFDAQISDFDARAKEIIDTYDKIGYNKSSSGEDYLDFAIQNAEQVELIRSELTRLGERYLVVANLFGLSTQDNFQNALFAAALLELITKRTEFCEAVWFDASINRDALEMLNSFETNASNLKTDRDRLFSNWTEPVFDLDLSGLQILFSKYPWILDGVEENSDITEALKSRYSGIRSAFDSLIIYEDRNAKACALLGLTNNDSIEALQFMAVLLSHITGVPYIETSWFDVRKNDAGRAMLSEAQLHANHIKELTESVLEKWEPEALSMGEEAVSMLGRFKTDYVGAFRKMKAGYKEDIKKIRLLSKNVGHSVEESEAIALLQTLKEISDEKLWFTENQYELQLLAGSYFRADKTDWDAVNAGMDAGKTIAECFTYNNIPDSVISAIQKSASSIQLAAEIRELSEILSSESISRCVAAISEMHILRDNANRSSLRESIIPEIQDILSVCESQQKLLQTLNSLHNAETPVSIQDLRELTAICARIRSEKAWFTDNKQTLDHLYGMSHQSEYSRFEALAEGIVFAKAVIDFFDNSIPAKTIKFLSETPSENGLEGVLCDCISQDYIEKVSSEMQSTVSFVYSDTESFSEHILIHIKKWLSNTEQLSALYADLAPHIKDCGTTCDQAIFILPFVLQTIEMRKQAIKQESVIAEQLGEKYNGLETDWDSLERELQTVIDYCSAFSGAVTPSLIELICDNNDIRQEIRAAINDTLSTIKNTNNSFSTFVGCFSETEKISEAELYAVAERYDLCMNNYGDLNKWLDFTESKAECDARGLECFTDAIVKKNNTVSDILAAFERGFYSQWLSAVIADIPSVQSFRKLVHEQHLERFIKLDKKQYEIARDQIRSRIIRSFPSSNSILYANSDLALLKKEMGKKTHVMPLRKLFKSIPSLLLTLKPCLMMSPLSVAYFLDSDAYQFDTVIFDEASQVFPQDAIGAIFRAKQVIIAGDTKQLPPTNFFAANTSNGNDDFDDDEEYEDEIYDSILEETASVLPNRTLLWHYRSKHEHLIAFSNQEIYNGELVTFPSSNEREPDTGVEFEFVEDGYYEPSPKNYNLSEAKRIVELVRGHIDRYPERSLGIIAFSEKQQQAIATEMQRFREKHAEYEAFFAEDKEDAFFVKNLENVQGDERDTIIFSIGYAKTKEQKANGKPMSLRFGPLSNAGGERRLNVAITRAKINVKLVSSILPSDIDLSRTDSEGVRMLRAYIEFAKNGAATLASSRKATRPDDFVDTIANFISEHGYNVSKYVGCSGYKIDIAVQHPSESVQEFVAGIECDGFSYASARTARDRDRLRSTVLKNMGWNLYRIWSSEWYKNPEIEAQNLLAFIRSAVSVSDERIRELEKQKLREEEEKRAEREKRRAEQEAEERNKRREEEARDKRIRAEIEAAEKRVQKKSGAATSSTSGDVKKSSQGAQTGGLYRTRSAEDYSWVVPGATVRHNNFGLGTVVSLVKDKLTVRFGQEEKALRFPHVFENGLLSRAVPEAKTATPKRVEVAKVGESVVHKAFGRGIVKEISGFQIVVVFGDSEKTFVYPNAFTDGHLSVVFSRTDEQLKLLAKLKREGFQYVEDNNLAAVVWVRYEPSRRGLFESIISHYPVKCNVEQTGPKPLSDQPVWKLLFTDVK